MKSRKSYQKSRRPRPASGGKAKAKKPTTVPADAVLVNGYSARWLGQRFPWVYPKELESVRPKPQQEVRILGPDGRVLGRGLTDDGWIAVRVYRHDEGPLDDAWLDDGLSRALALRRAVVPAKTTAFRLIHGENDGMPGLRVDHWSGWLVCQCDSPAVVAMAERVAVRLRDHHDLEVKGAYICYRPDPRDPRDPASFQPRPTKLFGPDLHDDVEVVENGMKLGVRPWDGPDVGAYADMREVRQWLASRWEGRSVLNTFCYTGAFSVHAALHGASSTVSVDLASPVLERVEANLARNGQHGPAHEVLGSDTFRALDRFRRQGRRFDVVVLDPPSFSHGPDGVWSITQHLSRLVSAAARVLEPNGWLVAASNHGQTAPKAFRGDVAEGMKKAGGFGQELAFFGAAPDYPCATTFPEARYLKVGVWRFVKG